MVKIYSSILLVFVLSFLTANKAMASHAQGADISYECLGNNQYKIIYQFYRDCSGISASTSVIADITSTCGTSTVTLNPDPLYPTTEVSQLCPSATSTCNGGTNPGVQVYTYTAIVTLLPNCIYTVSYGECCRNTSNNLASSQSFDLYVETTINTNNALCNNGPRFTTYPVPYYCIGSQYSYSHGTYDIDGDSLVYSLVAPLQSSGTVIGYTAPYSPTNPMPTASGFIFDSQTGQMTFTPTTAGNYVVTVKVDEYRNGVLIGTTMRDIQFVVLSCTNTPPIINGNITTSNSSGGAVIDYNSLGVCPGATVTFNITAYDPTQQPITVTSNISTSIPGATLVTTPLKGTNDSVRVTFTWTPAPSDSGFRYFTITVKDNQCPITGNQVFTYDITVLRGVNAGPDKAYCPEGGPTTVTVTGGNHFSWTALGGGPAVGMVSASTDSNIVSFAPSVTTTYVVKSDLTGGCKDRDTITIFRVPGFSSNLTVDDDTICLNGTSTLTVHAYPDSVGPFSYAWTPTATIISLIDSNATVKPTTNTTYVVQITSASGCIVVKDSARIIINGTGPQVLLTSDKDYICPGDTIAITTNISAVNCGLTPGGSGSACPGGSSFISQKVGVGTATGNGVTPYQGFWTKGRVQYLFKANELQAKGLTAGTITDIAFLITSKASTIDYNNFTIKMGCTSLSQLTTSFVGGLQIVANPIAYTSYVGSNPHILDNPYDWDGFSNLIVEVCFDNGGNNYTGWDNIEYTANVFTGATLRDNDDALANAGCSLPTGTLSADRPNITFGMCNPPVLGYTFNWSQLAGTSPLTCTTCQNPKVALYNDGTYKLDVVDQNGCSGEALINLHVNQSTAITAGSDTSLCTAGGVQLNVAQLNPQPLVCVQNYSIQAVPYSAILPTGATTNIPAGDQTISGMLPIGFNFDFYCTTYTTFAASGNGFITFLTGQPYADFSSTIPTAGTPNGLVALCWDDLNASTGGTVDYFVKGTAPNRILVVRYNNVRHYASTNTINGEIHLYETSNVIEIMTQSQNDAGTHAQGIENATGTAGVAVPGRNSQAWTVSSPDGYRFTPQYSGVAPVSYSWTPSSGLSSSTIANPIATPSSSTCYTGAITYTNGCVVRDTVCINIGSFPHSVSVLPDTICAGDTAQLNFTGAGVTYAWTPAANVTNPAIANPKATVLNTTKFFVTATNAQGCSALDSVTLKVRPYTPVTLRSDTSVCPGGSLSISVPGGPYTSYEWYSVATGNTIIGTSSSITTLPGNDYFVKVQKPGICPVYSDTFTLSQYSLGTISTSGDTSICNGASLVLNATVGISNILWSNSATTPSITVNTAGDYFYSGQDIHGCLLHSDTTTLTVIAPPVITFAPVANPVCPYDIAILDAGSTAGVTYTWNPGNITSPTLSVTTSGHYVVTANANGCSTTDSLDVNFAPAPTVTLPAADQTVCPTDSFLIPVAGGTFSNYEWHSASSGAIVKTGNPFYGKPVDSFYVKVSDANGCVFTSDTFAVYAKTIPQLLPLVNQGLCQGQSATLLGTAGLTNVLWSPNGETTQDITVSTAGQYSYTALANGCIVNSNVAVVTVTSQPVITFSLFKNPVCPGETVTINAGLVPGVTYTWSPGGLADSITTGAGTVSVVADNNGCTATLSTTVNAAQSPIVTLPTDIDVCDCSLDTIIQASVTTLANPVTYQWSGTGSINPSSVDTLHVTASGAYTVTVTDANACTATATYSAKAWCLNIDAKVDGQNTINSGQIAQLNAVVVNSNYSPTLSYVWHPGATLTDSLIQNPKASPTATTTYIVYVADNVHNCSAFDTITIGVIPPGLYAIPTGFTPNGDGQNDYFYPYFSPGSTATVVSMRIYNRWGQLIYSGPSSPGWDGKINGVDAPVDTYTYYLEIAVPDANSPSGVTTFLKAGSFAIIR
jgi:gliding motility-associated-like protein